MSSVVKQCSRQDGVVAEARVCALQPQGSGFESLSLPMLLVEVGSPHKDPSLPCPK